MRQNSVVVIANGAACSEKLLAHYLSKNPTVIILDGAMDRFKTLGYQADYLVGDFDSYAPDFIALKTQFFGLEIIAMPDQNATDFEKGINFACTLNPAEIVVLWATGRRADHFFMNCTNLVTFPENISIQLVDDHAIVYHLPKKFEKKFQAKQQLSMIPIGTVTGISTNNLRYPLKDDTLILGQKNGNSNEVVATGKVIITHETGSLLLMECWD